MGLSAGRDLPPPSGWLTFGNTRSAGIQGDASYRCFEDLKGCRPRGQSIDAWSEPITDRQGQCGVG